MKSRDMFDMASRSRQIVRAASRTIQKSIATTELTQSVLLHYQQFTNHHVFKLQTSSLYVNKAKRSTVCSMNIIK